jgi:DNA replication protein DnaC
MIGPREYQALKMLDKSLTETELIKVVEYENDKKPKKTEEQKKYFEKLHAIQKDQEIEIDQEKLLKSFYKAFKHVRAVDFDPGEGRLENLMSLIQYFSKNKDFLNNPRLCRNSKGGFISEPSFNKGILIIGDFGCGKSSIMEAFKALFNGHNLTFKSFTTNNIVTTFESYQNGSERTEYINRTKTKTAYFDDVKTEKDASNYGKHNLLKDILEERYNRGAKTYITCNYMLDDKEKLVSRALDEFGTRYGPRVFDRLFEMFNIIEFKGSSLRK